MPPLTVILGRIETPSIPLAQLILYTPLNRAQRLVIEAAVLGRLVAGVAAVEQRVGVGSWGSVSGGNDGERDDCAAWGGAGKGGGESGEGGEGEEEGGWELHVGC